MKEVIDFIVKGSDVTRFHACSTIHRETVAEHSFMVAHLVHLLSRPRSLASVAPMILAALVHDLPEHITGDIPASTKRMLEIDTRAEALERTLLARIGLTVDLTSEDARILSIADALAGYLFCKKERELGNRNLVHVGIGYAEHLETYAPFSAQELAVINAILRGGR